MRRWRLTGTLGLCLVLGCASFAPQTTGHPCLLTTKPVIRPPSIAWHLFDVTVLSQLEQELDLVRVVRKVVGRPRPADDRVNGQVADSSFFTNRDIAGLSADDIRRGPTRAEQTATPPFVITRLKAEGKTAGFFVRDAHGERFLFKLDVPEAPELVTGAEVVASKLLHALGYFVPSYEIVQVGPNQLSIGPGLAITPEELRVRLGTRLRHGRLRVSASRLVDGDILGPFSFKQHRHCAELRALKLAYAWVNNTDAKDHNTLMAWTGTHAIGYLIDFGTSLGGDPVRGAKGPCQGWVNDVDLKDWTVQILTLGLHPNGCDPHERPVSPAVGLFSPRLDPIRWKPYAPNLAFEELTNDDGRWMARRLAGFSRAQLEAAVGAGQYSDPTDAERIVEILEARRNAILDTYLPDE